MPKSLYGALGMQLSLVHVLLHDAACRAPGQRPRVVRPKTAPATPLLFATLRMSQYFILTAYPKIKEGLNLASDDRP